MKDVSVTIFKLGSSFMHHVRTCCTRIRYSYWSDVFIQHERFDLLLDNSW